MLQALQADVNAWPQRVKGSGVTNAGGAAYVPIARNLEILRTPDDPEATYAYMRKVWDSPDAGAGSTVGNIIWFVLAGWWLAIGHVITGVLMCITIIGIPLGLANFKLIPVSLTPFGREIVDLDQARRLGIQPAVVMPADPRPGRGPG